MFQAPRDRRPPEQLSARWRASLRRRRSSYRSDYRRVTCCYLLLGTAAVKFFIAVCKPCIIYRLMRMQACAGRCACLHQFSITKPTIKETKRIMKSSFLPAAFALLLSATGMPVEAHAKHSPNQPPKSGGVDAKLKEELKDPSKLTEKAPATFKVKFVTTQGEVVIDVTRAWSPNGADRFYNLVKHGYFEGVKFFRVVPGFMEQFGIHGDPAISAKWRGANINDDPVVQSNKKGFISFATAGPN